MPIEGVDLSQMSEADAVRLIQRLYGVDESTARQMLAAELGRPFNDVIDPGDMPTIEIDNTEGD